MRRPAIALAAVAAAAAAIAYLRCREAPAPAPSAQVSRDGAGLAAPTARARVRLAELRHQPAGAIAGTVTAAGAPVPGATVCAQDDEDVEPRCTSSDAAGAYELDELPPADFYRVWASVPGRAGAGWPDLVKLAGGERRAGIDLVLPEESVEVRGRVTDIRGGAIEGARVQLNTGRPTSVARTGAGGAFVAWVQPGRVMASAIADGYVSSFGSGVAPTDALAIVLTPEGVVAGVVVEAGTRRPIDDAEVTVHEVVVRTGADGRFRARKVAPGRHKPTATAIGAYGEVAESVRVGLGETIDDVVIEVHPAAVVAGRIVIDDGVAPRPCPPGSGDVMLQRSGSSAYYGARAGADGDVLLEGVVPGTYEVWATCTGYLSQVPYPNLVVERSDLEDVEWRVAPGARITGRVRYRDGSPAARAHVQYLADTGVSAGAVTAAADGTFALDGVAPGAARLRASEQDDWHAHAETTVLVSLDRATTVELEIDAPRGSITGTVTDARGRAVSDSIVRVVGPVRRSAAVDARGAFAIAGLPAGEYEVSTIGRWSMDTSEAPVRVRVADGPALVRVIAEPPTGELAGRVRDAAGAPLADVYVVAARLDPDDASGGWASSRVTPDHYAVVTAADGGFRLPRLPRGRFVVRAYRAGAGEAIAANVAPGDRVELVIRPTGVLAGVVVAADGGPVDDVTVTATDKLHHRERHERLFHTGGRFALRELPAGTYKLVVDGDDRSAVVVTLAEGGRREDLRLVAQPLYTVRGRLVGPGGAPLRNWVIEAPRNESSDATASGRIIYTALTERAVTGADGRFLLRGLSAGPLELTAGDASRADAPTLAPLRQLVLGPQRDLDLGDVSP